MLEKKDGGKDARNTRKKIGEKGGRNEGLRGERVLPGRRG